MALTVPSSASAASPGDYECQSNSNTGGLYLGASRSNSGAPNFVPDGCTSIWMKLTEVEYITYAKACLEYSSGRNYRCGPWVYLEDGGAWNRLLPHVSSGDQWQLYMKAEGREYVGFDFSG
ncbi:hypothetical protein Apa02nite_032550 [Actinoplanes palleronii]|uniref:Secreted protein n=2 Tax=Actinoplanes palleronii TaxID=113570 RepID=A0ABQ4B8W3_9ACTN|nr:hypothetical protein Apa02nite_032550 [Actinoplanes palleronii]